MWAYENKNTKINSEGLRPFIQKFALSRISRYAVAYMYDSGQRVLVECEVIYQFFALQIYGVKSALTLIRLRHWLLLQMYAPFRHHKWRFELTVMVY